MIPTFPNHKKLEKTDYNEIRQFTSKFVPYSDYNFVSLYSYDTGSDIQLSQYKGNLIVKFSDYIDDSIHFYSFIGKNEVGDTIKTLLDYSASNNLQKKLSLIPEDCIKDNITKLSEKFTIEEDKTNHDYVCSTVEWTNLEEPSYKELRRQVRRFERNYPEHKHTKLDLSDSKTLDKIYNLFNLWGKNSQQSQEECEVELVAVKRFISLNNICPIKCYGIYIDDKLIDFEFAEIDKDNPKYGISHFAKFDKSIKDSYVYGFHSLCKQFNSQNCEYINIEQDLGLERLRHTKEKWNPTLYLKKYSISYK